MESGGTRQLKSSGNLSGSRKILPYETIKNSEAGHSNFKVFQTFLQP